MSPAISKYYFLNTHCCDSLFKKVLCDSSRHIKEWATQIENIMWCKLSVGWRTDITQDCPASSSSLWWSCCPAAVNSAIWTSTTTSCRFIGGGLWLWGAGAQLKRAPTCKSHDALMVNQFQTLVKTKIILLCESGSTTTHLPLKHTGNYWLLLTSTIEGDRRFLFLSGFSPHHLLMKSRTHIQCSYVVNEDRVPLQSQPHLSSRLHQPSAPPPCLHTLKKS